MTTPNTSPVYTATPDCSTNATPAVGGSVGSALTLAVGSNYDGTNANYALEHTAGANGSYVSQLRLKALGTNVATVVRVILNNGNTVGTASNNTLIEEYSLPATTASNTTSTPTVIVPLNIRIPPGWRIYCGLATAVAAGWQCVAEAGQY